MQQIKVKILPGGTTAREVNPLGEKPFYFSMPINDYCREYPKWEEAESKLRTFEIEPCGYDLKNGYCLYSGICCKTENIIHSAIVLDNGKVRII